MRFASPAAMDNCSGEGTYQFSYAGNRLTLVATTARVDSCVERLVGLTGAAFFKDDPAHQAWKGLGPTGGQFNAVMIHDGKIYAGSGGDSGNTVQGNFIGTDISGTLNLGNTGSGVSLGGLFGADNNLIGGTVAGAGNVIAFNGSAGLGLGTSSTKVPVLGNAIFSNGHRGLVLNFSNLPANDPGDGDGGANNQQNFPVLTAASLSGGTTSIQGTLNSTANKTFRLEFFAKAACDSSGHGEGQGSLGAAEVTTDGSSNAAFDVTLTVAVAASQFVTATATLLDANGDPVETSEFSACRVVTAGCSNITLAPATLPPAIKDSSYSQTLTASGGTAPYSFSLTGGALPNGLTLSSVGVLSGTPTQAGSFAFTVTVTSGTCNGSGNYTLTVGLLNLAATSGEGYIELNWTHSGFGTPTGFKLYRATSSTGPFTLVHTASGQRQHAPRYGCDAQHAILLQTDSRQQ